MAEREKVIEALRICREGLGTKSCRKCPYMRGRDGTGTCYPIDAEENGVHLCWQDLVEDAIALLKEQEPRVLALEKIQSGTVEVAWLECSDKEEVRAGLWFKRINEGEDEGIIIHVLDGFEGLRTEVYGKTWRCWSARPTEEQRKAVLWDG